MRWCHIHVSFDILEVLKYTGVTIGIVTYKKKIILMWINQCRICTMYPVMFYLDHFSTGSPLPGVSYRVSLGKLVCRWPGHHHWIAEGITTKADPLEDQYRRKGTSAQHGQNQGPDIWAGAGCASELWQRPLWRVHTFHFMWCLLQLEPQEMHWHPWLFEVWCQLQVLTVHWTGQTNRWQTNDIGHSRSGEAWSGAIFLLPWGLFWSRYYHKMPCFP